MKRVEKEALVAIIDDDYDSLLVCQEISGQRNMILDLSQRDAPAILKSGAPLISLAIFFNSTRCIEGMIQNDNALNFTDLCGRYPIHFAAAFGNVEAFIHLEKNGANIKVLDNQSKNVLHYAAMFGEVSFVQWLLKREIFDVSAKDSKNQTPLHLACNNGHIRVVSELLESGAEHSYADGGWTPLLLAVRSKEEKLVELVAKHCKDVNCTNSLGENCLHWAASTTNIKLINYFLNLIDINKPTSVGNTPLMFAAASSSVDVVNLLTNRGADISAVNKNGWNALHFACDAGNQKVIQVLIDKGVNINAQNNDKETPLITAVKKNKPKSVRLLLSNNARKDIREKNNFTAAIIAKALKNKTIYKLLREPKSSRKKSDVRPKKKIECSSRSSDSDVIALD